MPGSKYQREQVAIKAAQELTAHKEEAKKQLKASVEKINGILAAAKEDRENICGEITNI